MSDYKNDYDLTWDYITIPMGIELQYPYYQHLISTNPYQVNGAVYLVNAFGNRIRELASNEYVASCPAYGGNTDYDGLYNATVSYTTSDNRVFTTSYKVYPMANPTIANTMDYSFSQDYSVPIILDFNNGTVNCAETGGSGQTDWAGNVEQTWYNPSTNGTTKYWLKTKYNNTYARINYTPSDSSDWDADHLFEWRVGYDAARKFGCYLYFKQENGPGWYDIKVNNINKGFIGSSSPILNAYTEITKRYATPESRSEPLLHVSAETDNINSETYEVESTGHIEFDVYVWPIARIRGKSSLAISSSGYQYYLSNFKSTGTFTNQVLRISFGVAVFRDYTSEE